ncbi:MAG: hypothetical protein WDN27_00830 [Candidatus Saccharibacteria bacterium]
MAWVVIVIIVIVLIIIANGVRIINQYERGVILRLGKVRAEVKQPGCACSSLSSTRCARSVCRS